MRLLFFTQRIDEDDDILGFGVRWVRALARRVERLDCVALDLNPGTKLPDNVTATSLGRELGRGTLELAAESQRVFWRLLRSTPFDGVFIHMAPQYAILAAPWTALTDRPMFFWYTHRQNTVALETATVLATRVFTASADTFPIETSKRHVLGHGIAAEPFWRAARTTPESEVLAVARLSPIKQLETFIEAAALMKGSGLRFRLVGGTIMPSDAAYRDRLERLVSDRGLGESFVFEGSVSHRRMPSYYARALCTVNTCVRSSFDKAVLESMAAGRPPLTSNPSFEENFGNDAPALLFGEGDAPALAERIEAIRKLPASEYDDLGARLHERVTLGHGLESLMDRVVAMFEEELERRRPRALEARRG